MALTAKEQFRYGMLTRFAELGMTPAEIRQHVKQATEMVKQGNYGFADLAKLYAQAPFTVGAYGMMGAAGLGALGGHALAKMTDDEVDPQEAKRQELIAALQQQAARARRNTARLQYRQPKPVPKQPDLF